MSEVISIGFPDISGDVTGHIAFVYSEAGALLNTGGDAITETGSSGVWTFTLSEARVENTSYYVRIYSGASDVTANLVFDGVLFAGQLIVDKVGNVTIRGTVGATAPSTTSFTPSSIFPVGDVLNKWVGRILIFDNDTTTVGLRGQATDITAVSAAALPLLTFTELSATPVSGDKFTIV